MAREMPRQSIDILNNPESPANPAFETVTTDAVGGTR